MLGGALTVAAGAWFVVGRTMAGSLGLGSAGAPVATTDTEKVWLELTYFYGLGALIVFLGALALGRLSMRRPRRRVCRRPVAADEPTTFTGPQPTAVPVGEAPTGVIETAPGRRRGACRARNRGRGRDDTLVER